MVPLSVLDLAMVATGSTPARALAETTELARLAQQRGFKRFWVAEHHGMPAVASSAPPVLIAHLAAATSAIRVGSGGVMLANHAPLVVAEQFATLEALHPGRIDLGLGRAPGTDMRTARALRHRFDLGAARFPEDVLELIGYLTPDERPGAASSVPGRGYLPEVWLLGSSLFSAELAGALGLPYSFAYHFAPGLLDEALESYHSCFQASALSERPRVMVAASGVCAPSDEEARWLAQPSALSLLQLRTGRPGLFPTPEQAASYPYTAADRALLVQAMATHLIGDPASVSKGLAELQVRTGADELIISTRVHSHEARSRSLALVAETWASLERAGSPQSQI